MQFGTFLKLCCTNAGYSSLNLLHTIYTDMYNLEVHFFTAKRAREVDNFFKIMPPGGNRRAETVLC